MFAAYRFAGTDYNRHASPIFFQEKASPLHPHFESLRGQRSHSPVSSWDAAKNQGDRLPARKRKPREQPPRPNRAKLLSCPAGSSGSPPLQASGSHRVVLTWNASVPIPNAANDPVQGYCVYRSAKKKAGLPDKIRVSANPIAGTGCVDDTPQDGQTYYYSLLAISSKSRTSVFSGRNPRQNSTNQTLYSLAVDPAAAMPGDAPLPQN